MPWMTTKGLSPGHSMASCVGVATIVPRWLADVQLSWVLGWPEIPSKSQTRLNNRRKDLPEPVGRLIKTRWNNTGGNTFPYLTGQNPPSTCARI